MRVLWNAWKGSHWARIPGGAVESLPSMSSPLFVMYFYSNNITSILALWLRVVSPCPLSTDISEPKGGQVLIRKVHFPHQLQT